MICDSKTDTERDKRTSAINVSPPVKYPVSKSELTPLETTLSCSFSDPKRDAEAGNDFRPDPLAQQGLEISFRNGHTR